MFNNLIRLCDCEYKKKDKQYEGEENKKTQIT